MPDDDYGTNNVGVLLSEIFTAKNPRPRGAEPDVTVRFGRTRHEAFPEASTATTACRRPSHPEQVNTGPSQGVQPSNKCILGTTISSLQRFSGREVRRKCGR
jgi:hypothetical protein